MTTRFEEIYRIKPDDSLTDDLLNRRFKDLDDRLSKAEIARMSEDQGFSLVLDRVLGRSEEVIASLRDRLLQITQLQWLTARSTTARTLALEAQFALEIIEEERDLFAPGPYAVLTWTGGGPEDYAVVRTLGYDRLIGQWDVRVEAFTGAPGPWASWQIAAIAGSTLSQRALLSEGRAVRGETVAARNTALEHRDASIAAAGVSVAARDVSTAAAGVATEKRNEAGVFRDAAEAFRNAAAAIQQAVADASAPILAGLAGKQNQSANGDALAGLGLAANKLPYATGAGALALTDLSAVARTLLGQASQALMRTVGLNIYTATPAQIRQGADDTAFVVAKALKDAQAFVDLGNVSGAVTLDLSTGINFKMRAIGNIVIAAPIGAYDGYVGIIKISQDATGGRTVAVNSAIKKTSAITLSTAANAVDQLTLWYDGAIPNVSPLMKGFV
ncbi:hypothetical protein [Brevundimonas bacteroides]|uniref:hypothetical protein n=1 Tax=Brevundimonas bacteroides TaxID=74311 RepID=UPI0004982F04|nr:hypothetical protein [Brevundimonas bacteroides]